MPEIKIKPIANNHGQFLTLVGVIGLLVTIAISHHFWSELRLVFTLLLLASLVTLFIGLTKRFEPEYSLLISPQGIKFSHKYGGWKLPWTDVLRFDQLNVQVGLDRRILPYIGIRLSNCDSLVESITPRLASRLPHEQRPLLTMAITQSLLTIEQAQINFSPYKHHDDLLKGPIALYMHHTQALAKAYGYHVYLPLSALDRSGEEFIQLLKQCQAHRHQYSP
ncbi:DUF2982 domain-containing protein [Thalassotalea euphylliae]|uniref:DUF2982 domain-containing protein n=1 Tax=Thalassotalea euphylliae TaxID=1655234 RepID=A0A3E0UF75_9GAMM|nr:DUF2982 domain-containing protein [Thalassotalea euphylliae]REL35539.1 DUF2982 domain-containing protein [Thalassotalea euphylliae]